MTSTTARSAGPAIAAAMAAILIWGGSPIATRIAVASLDPAMVGMLRTLLAAVLAPLALVALGLHRLPPREARAPLVFAALCAFVGFPILFSVGIEHTSASHAALILAMQPIFTALTAHVVERTRPGGQWVAGAIIAAAGAFALVHFRIGVDPATPESWFGDVLILGGGLLASIGYVAGGKAAQRQPALAVTLWGLTIGGLALLPLFAWRAGDVAWSAATPAAWTAVAYLAFAVSSLGYLLWYGALARGGIARIGSIQFLQPVTSLVLAVILLGEPMTPALAACAAIVVFGTFIAQRR